VALIAHSSFNNIVSGSLSLSIFIDVNDWLQAVSIHLNFFRPLDESLEALFLDHIFHYALQECAILEVDEVDA